MREPVESRKHKHSEAKSPDSPITLSVIIPAYNESKRLPPYLEQVRRYLTTRYGDAYEVIVVDDGSSDQLPSVLDRLAEDFPQLMVLRHSTNRGKGAAVRTGMARGVGERLLFVDADGATPISEEAKLSHAILNGADVAVGSRLLPDAGVERGRTRWRAVTGRTFAWLARNVIRVGVKDTQCGFKMFERSAGRALFTRSREERYLFDIELLAFALRRHYNVIEVPISWSDQPNSRLNLWRETPRILFDLWRLRHRLAKQDTC